MSVIRLFALAAAMALAGVTALVGADGSATPRDVTFARPGLVIKLTGAEIAPDGIIQARVKLTDLRGLPLDRLGVETPGAINVSFIAAYIPLGKSTYWAYTTRSQKSPITSITEQQASADSGGAFTQVGPGEYVYTFRTKAANYNPNLTHTIGAYGSRNMTDLDLGTQYDDDVLHFIPAKRETVEMPRDIIRTATCNKCHYDMGFHGGSRKSMELCILCHSPQTKDPDTGNSVDMAEMTHKIHMGANLPSVQAGKKYTIIGNNQSVHDYSGIVFPADARNCQSCHEQGTAAHAESMFKPNRAACGACHDNVNFQTGQEHANLPQFSDSQCATCHVRQGELDFDASILGAHTIPRFSKALPGLALTITGVANAGPGKSPTIAFTAKDKAGDPLAPSQMSRLNFRIAGPSSDYTTMMSENALTAKGENGTYTWTTRTPLPSDAAGTFFVSLEGRRDVKLLEGTQKEMTVRDTALNSNFSFAVDGGKVEARRRIVTNEKCNACHGSLAFHGDARNTVENCVTCHNPTATAGSGEEEVSIDFRVMVHRIHRGHGLTRPYSVGGHSYNEVGYPGDLRNCGACHVGGSEQLPLRAGLSPVTDPRGPLNALMPTAAACTGCHDSNTTAAHVEANTNRLGESCATCHGPNAQFAVSRVHKR